MLQVSTLSVFMLLLFCLMKRTIAYFAGLSRRGEIKSVKFVPSPTQKASVSPTGVRLRSSQSTVPCNAPPPNNTLTKQVPKPVSSPCFLSTVLPNRKNSCGLSVFISLTEEELLHYNGLNSKPIYIALKGNIYDVSKNSDYYGPEQPYHSFAGKNITTTLAKKSIEFLYESCEWEHLSMEEKRNVEYWESIFKQRYTLVGFVETPQVMPSPQGHKKMS
eukprot:TRINITY_DN24987_c0_g1_i1.p1 TRINITY_DN24987_c0_g1~~TRINITY_DN24987_c0_g1_i1.p1  ORF type:complete len:242 (-),score=33.60 TRINITY_DN24987_c0_g1_i1:28-681(-)